mgnify:CR=1 FL=1
MVTSYIFRRAVCRVPTNSLNKTFAGFSAAVRKDRYVESVVPLGLSFYVAAIAAVVALWPLAYALWEPRSTSRGERRTSPAT